MVEHLTPTTVFKCLADETRVRLMLLITREDELCVCELTCALDESQPKVSRHLAQLRNCGLLEDRRIVFEDVELGRPAPVIAGHDVVEARRQSGVVHPVARPLGNVRLHNAMATDGRQFTRL